jgi:hypothetical protein
MATTVQSILQEYFEQFARSHPLSVEQRLAAKRLRDCRTPALGGHESGARSALETFREGPWGVCVELTRSLVVRSVLLAPNGFSPLGHQE